VVKLPDLRVMRESSLPVFRRVSGAELSLGDPV
jgi:hypothetical protein